MKLVQEFKTFIARGNVIDLAVGVIIGGAFGAIVTSLVNDVVMPPIGLATAGADFSNLFIALDGVAYDTLQAARDSDAPVIAYGAFLNTIIKFLIVAACIFGLVKVINRIKREEEQKEASAPAAPPRSEVLLEEIRDLLKK